MHEADRVVSQVVDASGLGDRVVKRYGARTVLHGIDLEVARGEIVCVLGPNGAGKSTLLRILATILIPDGGTVTIDGTDALREPLEARRSMGFAMTEERSWYWRLTGRENLRFFAALSGVDKEETAERVDQLLTEFGLADAADRMFQTYSTGMRARLSLARAFLLDPVVVLLDEPTRSVDPVVAGRFRRDLLGSVERRGMGVVLATHDLHEAATVASRVVILNQGRIVAATEPGLSAADLEERLAGAVEE